MVAALAMSMKGKRATLRTKAFGSILRAASGCLVVLPAREGWRGDKGVESGRV